MNSMATEAQDQPASPGGRAEGASPAVDRHGALTARGNPNAISFFSIAYGDILRIVEFWAGSRPAPEHPRPFLAPLA